MTTNPHKSPRDPGARLDQDYTRTTNPHKSPQIPTGPKGATRLGLHQDYKSPQIPTNPHKSPRDPGARLDQDYARTTNPHKSPQIPTGSRGATRPGLQIPTNPHKSPRDPGARLDARTTNPHQSPQIPTGSRGATKPGAFAMLVPTEPKGARDMRGGPFGFLRLRRTKPSFWPRTCCEQKTKAPNCGSRIQPQFGAFAIHLGGDDARSYDIGVLSWVHV
jgi:hypothetical protein